MRLFISMLFLVLAFGAHADALNLFAGLGGARSASEVGSRSTAGGAFLFGGLSRNDSGSSAVNESYANVAITETGVLSNTGSGGSTTSFGNTAGLGLTGGLAGGTGQQGGFGDAGGVFGTLGIGFPAP